MLNEEYYDANDEELAKKENMKKIYAMILIVQDLLKKKNWKI